jgi:hypothetical protein
VQQTLDKPVMLDVVQRAEAVGYNTPAIDSIRDLVYNTSEDEFVKKQLKAAVALKDNERTVRRMIKLKKLVMDKSGDLFSFSKYMKLYSPVAWADFKFISLKREELARGMLRHSKDTIHQTLTDMTGLLAQDQKTQLSKIACRTFKNILGYMGDRKAQYPEMLAQELLTICLTNLPIRDEIYCQLMKQLSNNPLPESKRKGWNLMQLCLDTFPPGPEFENYLEFFLRQQANPPDQYINLLHQTLFGGARVAAPQEAEMTQIINWQQPLRLGFDVALEMQVDTHGAHVAGPGARGGGPPRGEYRQAYIHAQ